MDPLRLHPLHLLGIRHHGPGSARSVVAALERLQPDLLVVELPADTAGVLALVGRDDLVPPVALLGHVRDHPERAAFWPFASFSPEWCALRWAAAHAVPVQPFDLPLANVLAPETATLFDDALDQSAADAGALDPLAALAEAAGYDDAERWWEDVVEHRGDGEPTFAAIAEAMTAVRGDRVAVGREAAREAHMRKVLRAALAGGAQRVAVVCGAWHVPALQLPFPPASADAAVLRGLKKVPVATTWVPWTHRRLAAGTGYAAGVRSPGWYAHVHEHPGDEGLVRWFVEAGAALRGAGHQASPEHLIAAVRTASTLAAVRDRPRAGLDEVLESAVAVMGGGRPGPLALLHDRLIVGAAIGSVPEDTPMVPLARDLAAQQKACRLKPSAETRTVELDLRTDSGRARSRLLHRTGALELGWADLVEGRGSSGTFRETWSLAWEPEVSVRLIERSGLGTTVETAAATRLAELARSSTSVVVLVSLVERALLADLPVAGLVARLSAVAANAPDLADLMDALGPLARTARYGDSRGTDLADVAELIDSLVLRVVGGLELACHDLDPDAAQAMGQRLTSVQAALALVDHPARDTAWPAALERVARPDAAPLVAGRAARLLHDAGSWSSARTARLLASSLGRGASAARGAQFVEGFLGGGGAVLVHDTEMLDLLDGWIAGLDAEAFTLTAPLLRRTFGAFATAERRQIGELVSGRERRAVRWWHDELDPVRAAAALVTVRALRGPGR